MSWDDNIVRIFRPIDAADRARSLAEEERLREAVEKYRAMMAKSPPPAPSEEALLHRRMRESRPSKDDFLMGLAFAYSRRSHDQHTKHGCIVIDPRNGHVIATGYNGFLAGMDDDALPLDRPAKYEHIDHSEVNATAAFTRDPWSIPGGPIAYITGMPCHQCGRCLVRHNVLRWVVADRHGYSTPPADQAENIRRLVNQRGVDIRKIRPRLDWMVDPSFLAELRTLGFLGDPP